MTFASLEDLKTQLIASGFEHRAHLSDDDMNRAHELIEQDPGLIRTPEQELRYIEGMLGLPFGYITNFNVVAAPGYEKCSCGRVPSALEVVYFACTKQVHTKDLIRDTIISLKNTFEIATTGRAAECIQCGRKVVLEHYHMRRGYLYG
jgi:hypothetical protein